MRDLAVVNLLDFMRRAPIFPGMGQETSRVDRESRARALRAIADAAARPRDELAAARCERDRLAASGPSPVRADKMPRATFASVAIVGAGAIVAAQSTWVVAVFFGAFAAVILRIAVRDVQRREAAARDAALHALDARIEALERVANNADPRSE